MLTYWCKCAGNKNFGDVLGPHILKHISGKTVEYAAPDDSEIVVVGSIVEHLSASYSGIVAGIGCAKPGTNKKFRRADVRLLRGALTAARLGVAAPLGDPGLLASDFIVRQEKQYDVGFIGHYADKVNAPDAHRIDITWPIEKVIEETDKCRRVISSSLHGIILADALGIERMWMLYPKVQGGGFKFHDYASSFGDTIKPNVWGKVDAGLLAEKQDMIREVFTNI